MAVKLKIRKGDKVVVITGKDKGKQGEVIRVLPTENRALVRRRTHALPRVRPQQ